MEEFVKTIKAKADGMSPDKRKELSLALRKAADEIDQIDDAAWTAAYIDSLPDSAFLYIESGGQEDEEGKTSPRSLRHFPIYDDKGELDLPHLRNAIARIPQSNIPTEMKDSLQQRAQMMLENAQKSATSKSFSGWPADLARR